MKLLAGIVCGTMLLGVATVAGFATSIIIIRTPDRIVFAADGKPTWVGEQGAPVVCKIYRVEDIFFAVGGLTYDRERGFSPETLISRIASRSTFENVIHDTENSVSSALSRELQSLSEGAPVELAHALSNKSVVSLFFVTVESGIPRTAIRLFEAESAPPFRITVKHIDCPGQDCPKGTGAWWLGKVSLSDVAGHASMTPEEVAEAYLNEEIKTEPTNVGPPIQILRITKGGFEWIKNSGICPAVPR